MFMKRSSLIWLAAALTIGGVGCGGSDAPETFHLSGNVTFDGKPVASGRIRFMPDSSKGNSGTAGYAEIKEGKFDTSAGGKGHVSGPMIVSIEATDPSQEASPDDPDPQPSAPPPFPRYQTTVELPKEDTTKDFEVPADAAKVKVKSGPA
jgi:hypothetical protein